MTQHIGAEPKDGDFVAYLAEIERRQMKAMHEARGPASTTHPLSVGPASSHHGGSPGLHRADVQQDGDQPERAPLNKAQADAIVEMLTSRGGQRAGASSGDFVGGLIVGFVALVFFLAGVSGGSVIPMLIGIFLAWLAFTRLRKALRGETSDLAERLQRKRPGT